MEATDYRTIHGCEKHSPSEQKQVDHAAKVLSEQFGENYAAPSQIREYMANPENVLLVADMALAIVLRAGLENQRLWLMCVEPDTRGKGEGGRLLDHIIAEYAGFNLLRLDCPAEREAFYSRHGFHTLYTAEDGNYCYMTGPALDEADVAHLRPPWLS